MEKTNIILACLEELNTLLHSKEKAFNLILDYIANNLEINNEKRKIENEKSEVIAKLAKQMINNADIILRADKLITENKSKNLTIKELIK